MALRQSAALLGARGLCVVRRALDGGVVVVATHGEVGDDDALTAALAALPSSAEPGAGDAPWVGATPLGETGHVLLSFSDLPLDAFALTDASELICVLLNEHDAPLDPVRFVGDLASNAAPVDELLAMALQRAADLMGMEAAVLLCVEAEAWDVEALYDPQDTLDVLSLLATDGLATLTYRASGAVGLHDVRESPYAEATGVGAYLGAPIVSGRHGLGVLAFLSSAPREQPFAEKWRELVTMLARWAGVALGAQVSARRLAASEATLARMMEGSPHPIGLAEWVVAVGSPDDLLILDANTPAARILGVGAGDRLSDALPPAALRLWTAACRRALKDGALQPFRADVIAPGESESRRLAVTLGLVAEPDGEQPARVTFLAEDVTGRRHLRRRLFDREAQLLALLEAAPLILFELDESGRFTFAEGRALALSGVHSSDLVGESVYDRYRLSPATTHAVGRVLAGEPTSWSLTLGRREFEVTAAPAYGRDGRILGARGVAVDVTERNAARHSAESALAEASQDARHSADLMALLSHGLRDPLATILGFSDLLEEEEAGETQTAGSAISRAAAELLETLDGFLDLSQLSALRTAAPTPVGPPGLLAALQTALSEGTTDTAASLDLDAPESHIVVNIGLLRAAVRRIASIAKDTLEVRATTADEHLMLRFESPGLGERLASDSLHTAYVFHAATALGADLALDGDHAVGLGVPVQEARVVDLEPPSGDGSDHLAALA